MTLERMFPGLPVPGHRLRRGAQRGPGRLRLALHLEDQIASLGRGARLPSAASGTARRSPRRAASTGPSTCTGASGPAAALAAVRRRRGVQAPRRRRARAAGDLGARRRRGPARPRRRRPRLQVTAEPLARAVVDPSRRSSAGPTPTPRQGHRRLVPGRAVPAADHRHRGPRRSPSSRSTPAPASCCGPTSTSTARPSRCTARTSPTSSSACAVHTRQRCAARCRPDRPAVLLGDMNMWGWSIDAMAPPRAGAASAGQDLPGRRPRQPDRPPRGDRRRRGRRRRGARRRRVGPPPHPRPRCGVTMTAPSSCSAPATRPAR